MVKLFKVYKERYHKVYKILGVKFKIKRETHKYFTYIKNDSRVKNYKFVHVMNNGLHSVNILKFINKNFDNSEHCFIFPCIMFYKTQKQLQNIKNVFYCSLESIDYNSVNKIVIHGLFDSKLIQELYKYKKLLKKTFWFIWGGICILPRRVKRMTMYESILPVF